MGLLDDISEDVRDIYEDSDEATVPILITSPPEVIREIPKNTEFGTLDPLDVDNQIHAYITDHYTQYDPETGVPQEGLSASLSITLKTLLDLGIIDSTSEPALKDFKFAWLDPTGGQRRDFLLRRIHPTRTFGYVVVILGEFENKDE